LLGTETAPENNAPTGEDTGKYTDARAPLGGPTRDAGCTCVHPSMLPSRR